MTKMTKVQLFQNCINFINGDPVCVNVWCPAENKFKQEEVNPLDLIEGLNHEIELLNKRASTPRKPSAKQLENEDLKKIICDILAENKEPVPMKTIMASADFTGETISNQRMTQLVTALRREGKVKRTLVKRVAYYEIGCEEEEEEDVES